MLLVITSISFFVHLYSVDYMNNDPYFVKFFSYLSLFTFFMLMLVTSGNFIQLFFGWEGVGITSFLLISFWSTRLQANKSALKAIFFNRVGDLGLILAIFFVFFFFYSFDFFVIFPCFIYFKVYYFYLLGVYVNFIDLISFLFFIGVVGKSAQIGLHTWLPDAMEGPTPVSALLHAATMVTAGVFLLVRCSYIFEFSSTLLMVVCFIGSLTSFISSTIGILQYDIKKIVAYSTCSQLGYMVFSCGLSNYSVAMFHLFNHAFFKALLFLSMGSIIHSLIDEQDLRKMGGYLKILPFSYIATFIGVLSLVGFPFLTGFFSKEFILELSFSNFKSFSFFSYCLGVFSAFFTTVYSFRLLYFIFLSQNNSYKVYLLLVVDSPLLIFLSILNLIIFSIFFGYFFKDIFVGIGSFYWGLSVFILFMNNFFIESENIFFLIKLFPLFLVLLGFFFSFSLFVNISFLFFRLRFSFIGKFFYLIFNRL